MHPAPKRDLWKSRRVAVTGGAGFIGSTVARTLADLGAEVTVLDSFSPLGGANRANLIGYEDKIDIREGDVRDRAALASLIEGRDVLFNLAAQTSHQDSMDDPEADLEINCRAQLDIVETCRAKAPDIRLVYASTRQLYGRADYLPVDENHPVRPPDVNGVNKLSGENYHLLYTRVYGLRANVARLTNTFGPRMRIKDARQMFLGSWIGAALNSKAFEVWGGEQKRDLCYVDDAAAALIALADAAPHGRVFNIGGQTPIALKDLAALVIKAAGQGEYSFRAFPAERKAIDIGDYYADDRALRAAADWVPEVSIEEGLARTLAYYKAELGRYK